jgi:hypothetical protein
MTVLNPCQTFLLHCSLQLFRQGQATCHNSYIVCINKLYRHLELSKNSQIKYSLNISLNKLHQYPDTILPEIIVRLLINKCTTTNVPSPLTANTARLSQPSAFTLRVHNSLISFAFSPHVQFSADVSHEK